MLEKQVKMDRQVNQVGEVRGDRLVNPASLDSRDHKVQLVLLVNEENKENVASLDNQVHK